jgi:hypothetical protein
MSYRPLFLLLLLSMATAAWAQGGIRVIVYNFEQVMDGGDLEQHFGLGYDQDLDERLSLNFSARISDDTWAMNYRTAYHFSDVESTSFYFGPTVGVRSISSTRDNLLLVPVGLRMGVRGGLAKFYMDAYAGIGYNIGSGKPLTEGARNYAIQAPFCFGVDFGWGWEGDPR